MEYTISPMSIIFDGKRGYAFIDKWGGCIIITYGEANVKKIEKMLQGHSKLKFYDSNIFASLQK